MNMIGKNLALALTTVCAACVAADTKPAPQAAAAGQEALAAMNQPQGTPVEQAFAFLPDKIAEIGGKAVTKADFIAFVKKQLPNGQIPAGFPLPMLKNLAPQMIDQYVTEQVVNQAVAARKISVTPEEATAKLKEEFAKMPKDQQLQFEQMLKSQNQTLDQVIAQQVRNPELLKALCFDKLVKALCPDLDKFDPAEVKKFYDEHPREFVEPGDAPDTVRASHILIQVAADAKPEAWDKAKAEAEAILKQLKGGADFAKLAQEKSSCPSKAEGGSLGSFGKGQMVPEFETAAFALKEGELSQPVRTKFGYHIIRRDAAKKGRQLSFDEVKDRLTAMLKQQKQAEKIQTVVQNLKKEAGVKVLVTPEAPKAPAAPKAPEAPKAPAAKAPEAPKAPAVAR